MQSTLHHYDPFGRGPHPVGVRSVTWTDTDRDRALDVEIWYPATDDVRGRDLDPATQDRFPAIWTVDGTIDPATAGPDARTVAQSAVRNAIPAASTGTSAKGLVLFSHGYAGFRREATFVPTHLASHGYVVIGADHAGSCAWDVEESLNGGDGRPAAGVAGMAQARKGDVPFLVDRAYDEGLVPPDAPLGVTGISMGGWTTLISPAVEPRVRAIAPMCPAGGRSPVSPGRNELHEARDLSWSPEVATLMMVADGDAWLPLPGQLEQFSALPGDPTCVVLLDADHNHFVDDIEMSHEWFRDLTESLIELDPDSPTRWDLIASTIRPYAELVPGAVAEELWRGLTVAHFDAHLLGHAAAAALLTDDLEGTAAKLGAAVVPIRRHSPIAATATTHGGR